MRLRISFGLLLVFCVTLRLMAEPLAPDDASIVGSLLSWHRDAGSNYSDGVWKSNVGPDLVELGEAGDGDVYDVPELSTWTPSEGFFEGLEDVNGVLFLADVSDMLFAPEVNGGDGFEELTLIGVYQTTGNTDRTRPVGISSRTEAPVGDAFNLSSDASLRYDNGNNRTDPSFHLPDLTFRAGQLFDGLVNDFLDGELITEEAIPGGSFSGITRNDELYIGDLRGGINDPFTQTDLHDIFVAEVLVYNSKLNEDQISGIGEWLIENLATGIDVGDPCDFDGNGTLDILDIDALRQAVADSSNDSRFDIDGNGAIETADIVAFVESPEKINSYIGDSNMDGEFSTSDFVTIFQAGQFEDNIPNNSTWGTGDWNGDGEFSSGDLVLAFQRGGFEEGPRTAQAVPEPSSLVLIVIGATFACRILRDKRVS